MSDTFSGSDIAAAVTAASAPADSSSSPAASQAAEPSGQPAQPEAATTQPAAAEGSTDTTSTTDANAPAADESQPRGAQAPGPIPFDRHKTALDNARAKTRAEVEAEYAWAKSVDRGEFEAARQWVDLANREPMAAVDRMVQHIARTPDGVKQLRSYMGRMLGLRQGAPQGAPASGNDPMPGPDIPTSESNGQPVVYSAQQLQKYTAWMERQMMARFQQELAPFREDREAAQRREQQARMQRDADQYSARTVEALKTQPGFLDHIGEISKVYNEIPENDPRTEGEKLRDAYLQVVGSKMSVVAQRQAVADINRKAAANTVPANTNAPAPAFDWKTASWEDGLRHEWERRKKAGAR